MKKWFLAMFANQILEGLYISMQVLQQCMPLGKSGKMLGSSQMIRFIQRDEVTHLLLFQNMINSTRTRDDQIYLLLNLEEEL